MYVFLGTGDSLAQALPEGILKTLTNQRGSGTDQSEWRYQMGRWGMPGGPCGFCSQNPASPETAETPRGSQVCSCCSQLPCQVGAGGGGHIRPRRWHVCLAESGPAVGGARGLLGPHLWTLTSRQQNWKPRDGHQPRPLPLPKPPALPGHPGSAAPLAWVLSPGHDALDPLETCEWLPLAGGHLLLLCLAARRRHVCPGMWSLLAREGEPV